MKLEYSVRIERLADSDGGGYLATVPDLPGCVSTGDTREEVLRNIREAIALHLDGEDLTELGFSRDPTILATMELEAVA